MLGFPALLVDLGLPLLAACRKNTVERRNNKEIVGFHDIARARQLIHNSIILHNHGFGRISRRPSSHYNAVSRFCGQQAGGNFCPTKNTVRYAVV